MSRCRGSTPRTYMVCLVQITCVWLSRIFTTYCLLTDEGGHGDIRQMFWRGDREIGMRPDWTNYGKEAVIRAKDALDAADEFRIYIIDWQNRMMFRKL